MPGFHSFRFLEAPVTVPGLPIAETGIVIFPAVCSHRLQRTQSR